MKQLLFIISLSLLSVIQTRAQSYQPFVVEGKRWNCQPVYYDMAERQWRSYDSYFTILGDTLMDDVSWKQLRYYSEYRDTLVYVGGMREEDRKVYYCEGIEFPVFTDVHKPVLLYDFRLQAGESMPTGTGDAALDFLSTGRLYEKKTVDMENGRSVDVYVFDSGVWEGPDNKIPTTVWFEGIGTNYLFWPLSLIELPTSMKAPQRASDGWSLREELESSKNNYVSCELDDVVLAKAAELEKLTYKECNYNDVQMPSTAPSTSGQSFDLQGRRLAEAPAKGVFIQNGRKTVKR